MRKILIKALMVSVFVLLLPFALTLLLSDKKTGSISLETMSFTIQTDESGNSEKLDFNNYIMGIVAANMPAGYHTEALKAQAVIARTYALYNMHLLGSEEGHDRDSFTTAELGLSYMELSKMDEFWGKPDYKTYFAKIENAVYATRNEILIYNNALILPMFFNTGSGITRDASEAWGVAIPYLKSVDSKQDVTSTSYLRITEYDIPNFIALLKNQYTDLSVTPENIFDTVQVSERDSANYVTKIEVGNHTITGEEFAKVLGLNSSSFYIEDYNKQVRIVCNGAGHGLGLSQYGANAMAEEGHTYKEILLHYYTGVQLVKMKESRL